MDESTPETDRAEPAASRGAGWRLLAAVVLIPWLLSYGITGAWAVTRGATAASRGLESIDVGYTRMVTPASVMLVGGLLLAAFAVVLAASLLIVVGARRVVQWAPVAVVAGLLTAGAVWAGVRGELHPGLWLLFFFGLAYALVAAAVQLWRVSRRPGRGPVVGP
jgi:hypothetical protein